MQARRDEQGVTLILAIVFVVVGALAVTALVSFAGGALLNSANLNSQRSLEYSADSATEIAIQSVRYRPNFYATAGSCLTPSPTGSHTVIIDTRTMAVYCSGKTTSNAAPVEGVGSIGVTLHRATSSTLFKTPATGGTATRKGWEIIDSQKKIPATTSIVTENFASHYVIMSKAASGAAASDDFTLVPPHERIITFYTCLADKSPCAKGNSVVTAVVAFNDVSSVGHECTSSTSQSCGTSMAILSWIERYANH